MAYPVVEARASGRDSGNVTSHPITLPSGIVAGELLLVVFSVDASETPTDDSGLWTRLAYTPYSTNVTGAIFYKVAEGEDSLSITTTTEEASHISFRISGAGTPTCTAATGSSTNSNPPNHTNPGGAETVLWIATRSGDSTVVATVAPESFGNLQTLAAASTGGASSNTAEYSATSAAIDPGTFTSATEQWVSFTIAVPPPPSLTAVGDTVQQIWNVLTTLGDTNQYIYHVRSIIGDTSQAIWHVRSAIGDTSQYIWNVLTNATAVGDIVELVWHTRASLGKTSQSIWNTRFALGDTIQNIWHTRYALGKPSQYVWHIRAVISNTSQAIWNVRSIIGDTIEAIWNLRYALGKPSQYIWNIRATVSETSQYIWNVLAGVSAVYNTLQVIWNVRIITILTISVTVQRLASLSQVVRLANEVTILKVMPQNNRIVGIRPAQNLIIKRR